MCCPKGPDPPGRRSWAGGWLAGPLPQWPAADGARSLRKQTTNTKPTIRFKDNLVDETKMDK